MTARRVVVTGLGVISALGNNACEFWTAVQNGSHGFRPLTGFEGLRMPMAARVAGYQPNQWFEPKEIDLLDEFAQFGAIAAREAVEDSGIEWKSDMRERSGVITGSCVGGKSTEDASFRDLYALNRQRFHPMIVPRTMANAAASYITMRYGLTGPSFTLSTACSSSSHAIGQAFWLIRQGTLDAAITGGSEAPFSLGHLKAWEALRVVAPETCRPFSKDRKGMILGEGAAMLVLETLEMAQARGARIYAEIAGFGMGADAHHITQPSAEGCARAMRSALDDAGIFPDQVGYINAHGTGTVANDATETAAIRMAFGSAADRLAVSSTKSMHGHTLGAAGAVEAVAAVLGLREGFLPPTANFQQADPQCDLDVIANVGRRADVEYALSNSFAFGGLNAVLALRRYA